MIIRTLRKVYDGPKISLHTANGSMITVLSVPYCTIVDREPVFLWLIESLLVSSKNPTTLELQVTSQRANHSVGR